MKTRQKTTKRGEGERNKKHSETAHKTNKTQIRAKGNRQHKETPRGEGRVGEGVGENETKNVKRRGIGGKGEEKEKDMQKARTNTNVFARVE